MKNERLLLRDARCEYALSLLTRLLSNWLKPCIQALKNWLRVCTYVPITETKSPVEARLACASTGLLKRTCAG